MNNSNKNNVVLVLALSAGESCSEIGDQILAFNMIFINNKRGILHYLLLRYGVERANTYIVLHSWVKNIQKQIA